MSDWIYVAAIVGLFAAAVIWATRWAEAEVARHVATALDEQAADWGEPARQDIEAEWWPWMDERRQMFADTPIYAQMRHEDDVWFAASVMADIDDLPGGAA